MIAELLLFRYPPSFMIVRKEGGLSFEEKQVYDYHLPHTRRTVLFPGILLSDYPHIVYELF